MGYEDVPGYLYFATGGPYVHVRECFTGSLVRTFGVPPGAASSSAMDFDDGAPSAPVWLGDRVAWRLWNLTSTGSLVKSLNTTFSGVAGLAYDRDTPGGPYLFVATANGAGVVYALNPSTGSVYYSFPAPVADSTLGGLAWDGSYLWTEGRLTNPPGLGWVFQFIGHETVTDIVPSSLGRVKALYR
jgi:hypothetical protein